MPTTGFLVIYVNWERKKETEKSLSVIFNHKTFCRLQLIFIVLAGISVGAQIY